MYIPDTEPPVQERARQQKRSITVGKLRPDIILYEEDHPFAEDIGIVQASDLKSLPDLLIVMGTSLQVPGIKKLVKTFATAVHALKSLVIFVNKTRPVNEWDNIFDYHVESETDEWVASLPNFNDKVTVIAQRSSALKELRFVTSVFPSKRSYD
jgi:NAD-dependent histone deacetylase SIR2